MKKILLVVAVLAVLLGAGFGIKTAYDKKPRLPMRTRSII